MKIGLDIGSTTIKCVVLDDHDNIIHHSYKRHLSQIVEMTRQELQSIADTLLQGRPAGLAITGSAAPPTPPITPSAAIIIASLFIMNSLFSL